jgi:hypothetical protein
MPDLEAVHREYADRVEFVGLSVDPHPADGWDLVDRTGVTYDVGHDEDSTVFRALGGVGMPTTVLIDADGAVVDSRTGAASVDDLRGMVDDLLERER